MTVSCRTALIEPGNLVLETAIFKLPQISLLPIFLLRIFLGPGWKFCNLGLELIVA